MSACILSLRALHDQTNLPLGNSPGAQWMRCYQKQAPYLPEYKTTFLQNLQFSGKYLHRMCFNFAHNYKITPTPFFIWWIRKKFSSYIWVKMLTEDWFALRRIRVFWGVMVRRWASGSWHVEGTCHLPLRGFRVLRPSFKMRGTTYPAMQCHISEDWNA